MTSPPRPPSGTLTFLFTDVEGSTQLWERNRASMEQALARHDALLRATVEAHGGYVFHRAGDAFGVAFREPANALAATIAAQRALAAEDWSAFKPLLVRMALHTGTAELRDGDYFGPPLNRAARLMAAGHGGQILLSLATQQLVRDELPAGTRLWDLGVHRLRDLTHSEHIFRLVVDDLPEVGTPPDTAEQLRPGERQHLDPALLPSECPYRGLHAFREEDAPFFFGREAFTELLVEAVGAAPMVGVIGPSGSGKSSVVFAGLVPRLRAVDGGSSWTVLEMRPGGRPHHALAGALAPLLLPEGASEIDRLAEVNKLAGYLRDGSVAPADVLGRVADRQGELGRLLLVADQFEELYTLCPDEGEHRAFQDLLFAAAFEPHGGPQLTLALTLRADFMGHALAYRPFADAMQKHDVKLGPMTREELARAVRQPAEAQGRAFESGLVERIVDDVGEKAGSLPLLEFALTKLWERQEAGWLTHEAYEASGRVEGAVAQHAEAVYDGLSPERQERARRVFVQLVQPGEGTEDTRRLATRGELAEDWQLVRDLADARLVTTSRDETGNETAEVVHEALIRSWQRLREWMNGDRAFRGWQERLRFALRQWEASAHDEGTLLRGAPLAEAESWLEARAPELVPAEREFVETGIDTRDREQREHQAQLEREAASARMLRQRAVLLAAALVVAGGLGFAAVVLAREATENARRADAERASAEDARSDAEREARIARARELAASAMSNLSADPERSILLALQAVSTTQVMDDSMLPEALSALHDAIQASRVQLRFTGHLTHTADVRFSPDGQYLGVATGEDEAQIIDAVTGRTVHSLQGHAASVKFTEFNPSGTRIATVSADGTVKVWDTASGTLQHTLEGAAGALAELRFSPNGELIATAGPDGKAILWEVGTGRKALELPGHTGPVNRVSFNATGDRVLTRTVDSKARIWDATSGREIFAVDTHPRGIWTGVFSPDGARLLTMGGPDNTAKIWDASTGEELLTIINDGTGWFLRAAYTPDGSEIAVAHEHGATVYSALTGETRLTFFGRGQLLHRVAISKDGTLLATGGGNGVVRIWDIETGRELMELVGHVGALVSLGFDASGTRLWTIGNDRTARVWDLGSRSEGATFYHDPTVFDLAYSPDGRRVATAGRDGLVRVWDALTSTPLMTVSAHTDLVFDVAFSRDGEKFATASKDKSAAIWDSHSGEELRRIGGFEEPPVYIAFSPDGRYLVAGTNSPTAKLVDLTGGQEIRSLTVTAGGGPARSGPLEIDASGDFMALASRADSVEVWNTRSWRKLYEIRGQESYVHDVTFNSDGTRFATAGNDSTAMIWDTATGEHVLTLHAGAAPIDEIAASRGNLWATLGNDGTVKVWSGETGQELFSIASPEALHTQSALEFSPDGSRLAATRGGNTVREYLLRSEELMALAVSRLTRGLTAVECRRFLHEETCPAWPRVDGARVER